MTLTQPSTLHYITTNMLTPKVQLTLNNPSAVWSTKTVRIPNKMAKTALGDEWLVVEKAASLLGVTLQDDDYTYTSYEAKDGSRKLAAPEVSQVGDTPALVWGSTIIPLPSLKSNKGLDVYFEVNKGVHLCVDPSEGDTEGVSFRCAIDTRPLGDEPLKTLKAAMRTGDYTYKDAEGNKQPMFFAAGGREVGLGTFAGQTLEVVGLGPADKWGKMPLVVLDPNTGSRVMVKGNAATQETLALYRSTVDGDLFTPEVPGTLTVGEERKTKDGKSTYPVTLISHLANQGTPVFSL